MKEGEPLPTTIISNDQVIETLTNMPESSFLRAEIRPGIFSFEAADALLSDFLGSHDIRAHLNWSDGRTKLVAYRFNPVDVGAYAQDRMAAYFGIRIEQELESLMSSFPSVPTQPNLPLE